MRHSHLFLAASALAATMLTSVSSFAQPLAYNDSQGFPFPPLFQQFDRQPEPQALLQERVTEEDSSSVVQEERFRRQTVSFNSNEAPGTVIIDTPNTYLYYVLGNRQAIRYGIGVGREGFTWAGTQTVAMKKEWPDWHPPASMIERQPYLPRFMAGGPGNPLGARAMYLGSTEYRIHGTNAPSTIGQRVSSGCIRLTNDDVTDLFNRVNVGAKVVVLPVNGRGVAQRPAPVRASYNTNSASRSTLAYGSQASRLY